MDSTSHEVKPITHEVLEKLTKKIAEIQTQFPQGLAQIILFGSHAKNQAKLSSDVDIALVFTSQKAQKIEDKPYIEDLFFNTFEYLKMDFFCTTLEKLSQTHKKTDANFNIRQEGRLLWKTTAI